MIILEYSAIWDDNFKLRRMINMPSKNENMHKNRMFYALIYINNHEITSISSMLSTNIWK